MDLRFINHTHTFTNGATVLTGGEITMVVHMVVVVIVPVTVLMGTVGGGLVRGPMVSLKNKEL